MFRWLAHPSTYTTNSICRIIMFRLAESSIHISNSICRITNFVIFRWLANPSIHIMTFAIFRWFWTIYEVATISRLLKIIGLSCRISSLSQGSFTKETYYCKEPTNRSHPIPISRTQYVASRTFVMFKWLADPSTYITNSICHPNTMLFVERSISMARTQYSDCHGKQRESFISRTAHQKSQWCRGWRYQALAFPNSVLSPVKAYMRSCPSVSHKCSNLCLHVIMPSTHTPPIFTLQPFLDSPFFQAKLSLLLADFSFFFRAEWPNFIADSLEICRITKLVTCLDDSLIHLHTSRAEYVFQIPCSL